MNATRHSGTGLWPVCFNAGNFSNRMKEIILTNSQARGLCH